MAFLLFFAFTPSILTLNCKSIRDQPKRIGLVQWLHSLPVCMDIVCLQETHCTSASECSAWLLSSGFTPVVSPGSAHSCGCIVLFRPSLSLVNSWDDGDGRFLQCEFSLHAKLFRVCCIYCPNRNPARDHFLDGLYTKIDPCRPSSLVISIQSSTVRWTAPVLTQPTHPV